MQWGNLYVAYRGCGIQIAICYWSQINIFAGEISHTQFVLGQHFGGPCKDQRRHLMTPELVNIQMQYPQWGLFVAHCFSCWPWSSKANVSLGSKLTLFLMRSSPGFIQNLLKVFIFLVKALFCMWVWFQYQTVALKLAYSLQNRGCFFWSWLTFGPFLWKQGFSATVPGFSAFGLFFWKDYSLETVWKSL